MDTVRRRDANALLPRMESHSYRVQELESHQQHGRFDNQTLRQILGNDVAVKQSQKTTSTRGGRTVFAKVACLNSG